MIAGTFFEPCEHACSETAFTCDDEISAAFRLDKQKGLQYAVGGNGRCHLTQAVFVKSFSRLIGVAVDERDVNLLCLHVAVDVNSDVCFVVVEKSIQAFCTKAAFCVCHTSLLENF